MARGSPPGGRLLAIVALLFWLTHLTGAVRAIRRQHGQGFWRQAMDQADQPPSGNARLHHSL